MENWLAVLPCLSISLAKSSEADSIFLTSARILEISRLSAAEEALTSWEVEALGEGLGLFSRLFLFFPIEMPNVCESNY